MTFPNYISQKGQLSISSAKDVWCGPDMDLLDLDYLPQINHDFVDNSYSGLWRYRRAIPIRNDNSIISIGECMTPISNIEIDGKSIMVKSEYLFPTGSYKDRGAAVLVSHLKEIGATSLVEDSSGNAGCAISAYSAKGNLCCTIYMPETTSPGKIKQIQSYGANTVLVPGDRSSATNAVYQALSNHSFASHVWNPYFFQGTKTFAYEIWEQTKGQLPDHIIFPTGNGTLIIGSYIGFTDLFRNQLIKKMPVLHASQAQNCNSLHHHPAEFNPTLAEGIAVKNPARKQQILDIINATGGTAITITESEIIEYKKLAGKFGHYIETTSAVGLAAVKKLNVDGNVLVPLTGSGLKQNL
jgi:threonine synthase